MTAVLVVHIAALSVPCRFYTATKAQEQLILDMENRKTAAVEEAVMNARSMLDEELQKHQQNTTG